MVGLSLLEEVANFSDSDLYTDRPTEKLLPSIPYSTENLGHSLQPINMSRLRPMSTRALHTSQPIQAGPSRSPPADRKSNSPRKSALVPRKPSLDYELDIQNLPQFEFDDATTLGFLRMERIREAQDLIRRVEADRDSLRGERHARV